MSAENTGKPVLGTRELAGKPMTVGEEPGASGAQLNGIEMHAAAESATETLDDFVDGSFYCRHVSLVSPSMEMPPFGASYE